MEDLNTVLQQHLQPTPMIIAERYKFYKREQEVNETISEHIAELRKLSLYC